MRKYSFFFFLVVWNIKLVIHRNPDIWVKMKILGIFPSLAQDVKKSNRARLRGLLTLYKHNKCILTQVQEESNLSRLMICFIFQTEVHFNPL